MALYEFRANGGGGLHGEDLPQNNIFFYIRYKDFNDFFKEMILISYHLCDSHG